jgi:hypothetical protein
MSIGNNDYMDNVYMQMRRAENYYKNKIVFNNLNVKEKELLEKNKIYKDKYKGKRCFILGNGPSVNKINFESLHDELVITVNEMFRHEDFLKLNSDFHFIADPYYFRLNKRKALDMEIIEKMEVLSDSNTVLFSAASAEKEFKGIGWDKKIKISYFDNRLYFYDGYKEDFDFTRFIPSFQAVVQWAIAFAVFMGCKDIYLLGCDATNIPVNISLFVKKDTKLEYAYSMSKESTDITKKNLTHSGLEYTLYGYWRIVHIFSELSDYCKRKGVGLYNCSQESILKVMPKRKFQNIINVEKDSGF